MSKKNRKKKRIEETAEIEAAETIDEEPVVDDPTEELTSDVPAAEDAPTPEDKSEDATEPADAEEDKPASGDKTEDAPEASEEVIPVVDKIETISLDGFFSDEKKEGKGRKILRIIGYVFVAVMILASAYTIGLATKFKVPMGYLILAGVVIAIVGASFFSLQQWITGGIVAKVLTLALIAAFTIANVYLEHTYDRLEKMSGITTQIDEIYIYVPKEDKAESLTDAADYKFGILKELDRKNTDQVLADAGNEVGHELAVSEYENILTLITALYKGDVDAIILNGAYAGTVTDIEGFENFNKKTRALTVREIESQVAEEEESDEDLLFGGERVFSIYVSGIDQKGSPTKNSNSDVNILMTINLDTHQILLINTPRDYYVELYGTDGGYDKLTHAGTLGAYESKMTMSKLYGVKIDDFVKVNYTGFTGIVDALDYVDVEAEFSFTSKHYGYFQGINRCNGKQALEFARTRKAFLDGDRQRGRNQMEVIKGLVHRATGKTMLMNYTNVLDQVTDCVATSMSMDEITALIKFQLDEMPDWDILMYSVNGSDAEMPSYTYGGAYAYAMIPDEETLDKAKGYLRDMYAGKTLHIGKDKGAGTISGRENDKDEDEKAGKKSKEIHYPVTLEYPGED